MRRSPWSGPLPASKIAVRKRRNVLISGGTGTGKTTLLNALAATIPAEDRIVLIEETSEILIDKPNLVRFEARRSQAPLGQEAPLPAVTIADLLRATLRHRPDRILVGEVRGNEAFDLLQALNTGHQGALSTIHANSGVEPTPSVVIPALERFELVLPGHPSGALRLAHFVRHALGGEVRLQLAVVRVNDQGSSRLTQQRRKTA